MLSIIPICEYTSVDLPIFMLMGIQIESIFVVMSKVAKSIDTEEWNSWVTEFGNVSV